jgi:Hemerythrin HHE cation binding domain
VKGPLHRFFDADHRRLDGLLKRAMSDPDRIDLGLFAEFRAGLLKHIGMEEKVLFLAAKTARRDRVPLFAKLRVDHGAIASLLVPTPTKDTVAEILTVLGPHNRREEEEGGIYDVCDEAVGPVQAERLLEELKTFPEIRLKGYNDAPVVHEHIRVNLGLSRAQWEEEAKRAGPA